MLHAALVLEQELAAQQTARIVGHALQQVIERLALFLGRVVFLDGRGGLGILVGFSALGELLVDRLRERLLLRARRLAFGRLDLRLRLARRAFGTLGGLLLLLLAARFLL